MLIDMHAHVIPDAFPEAGGRAVADRWPRMEPVEGATARRLVTGQMRFTARDTFFDAQRRLEAMEASGVDAEVVSPLPPLLDYELPSKEGRDLSSSINEFIAGLHAAQPSRIFGLGTVPLQDPDLAAGELSEVKELGLQGIEVGSNVGRTSLGDERFLGFFQEAERLGIPIFVHAATPTMGERLPATAMATFGFATEISVAAASVISSGLADKCPRLHLAFSHGAGGFPLMLTRAQFFWGGTWNEEPRPEGDGEGQVGVSPSEYARRFYYDALVFDRRALRYLIDMIGSDRLIVGTDFPAMSREKPADRTLRSMGLPADVHENITGNNCLRFLGMDR